MFAGHLAVAFGAKSAAPKVPLSLLIGASFGIDILWPIFLLLGIESVAVDPGNTAFTALNFTSYPWSHSLVMVLGWGLLLGVVALRLGISRRGAVTTGLVVVSHWLLDWITHRPDLPLWPGGSVTGLGLWNSLIGTYLVEGSFLALAVILYSRSVTFIGWQGRLAFYSLVLLVLFIWASQPFSPPPPDAQAIAFVGLTMLLLPFWGMWIEKNARLNTIHSA